jgi:hypothetical protein
VHAQIPGEFVTGVVPWISVSEITVPSTCASADAPSANGVPSSVRNVTWTMSAGIALRVKPLPEIVNGVAT